MSCRDEEFGESIPMMELGESDGKYEVRALQGGEVHGLRFDGLMCKFVVFVMRALSWPFLEMRQLRRDRD